MYELPFVSLPTHLTTLLKQNMQSTGENYSRLGEFILSNKNLHHIVVVNSPSKDTTISINKILMGSGWFGLRDRLCGSYLNYKNIGSFKFNPPVETVPHLDSVIKLEEKLARFTVQGFSRGYLLGLYLAMSALEGFKIDEKFNIDKILEDAHLFKVLSNVQAKTVKIDILVIMVIHFRSFFGEASFDKFVRAGMDFDFVLNELGEGQKDILYKNLLTYFASIGEESILIEQPI